MIQILYTIKFLFPFLLMALFFCLYKKEYGFMKRFYYKIVMSYNARKFYCIVLLTMLIFLNWCSFETDQNYAVACAALMTIPLCSTKWQTVFSIGFMRVLDFWSQHSFSRWFVIQHLT